MWYACCMWIGFVGVDLMEQIYIHIYIIHSNNKEKLNKKYQIIIRI